MRRLGMPEVQRQPRAHLTAKAHTTHVSSITTLPRFHECITGAYCQWARWASDAAETEVIFGVRGNSAGCNEGRCSRDNWSRLA